jgi:hypothetical protein
VVNTAAAEGDAASFVAEFIQRVQPEPPLAAAMREKRECSTSSGFRKI